MHEDSALCRGRLLVTLLCFCAVFERHNGQYKLAESATMRHEILLHLFVLLLD